MALEGRVLVRMVGAEVRAAALAPRERGLGDEPREHVRRAAELLKATLAFRSLVER